MNINKQRVLDEFYELIQIPCPSLGEREVADLLKKRLEELGGKVTEDMQAAKALNQAILWQILRALWRARPAFC